MVINPVITTIYKYIKIFFTRKLAILDQKLNSTISIKFNVKIREFFSKRLKTIESRLKFFIEVISTD